MSPLPRREPGQHVGCRAGLGASSTSGVRQGTWRKAGRPHGVSCQSWPGGNSPSTDDVTGGMTRPAPPTEPGVQPWLGQPDGWWTWGTALAGALALAGATGWLVAGCQSSHLLGNGWGVCLLLPQTYGPVVHPDGQLQPGAPSRSLRLGRPPLLSQTHQQEVEQPRLEQVPRRVEGGISTRCTLTPHAQTWGAEGGSACTQPAVGGL